MTSDIVGKKGLCQAAYWARQDVYKRVTLTAEGTHEKTGYTVFFEQSPITIFPPEFTLYHMEPGVGGPALTPFVISISFIAPQEIRSIVVHDANGRHEVPVL
jgi:hypothetical protein